ncbi:hypothetical protein GGS21DRAFT_286987 [Xylaria nigripes]|nr:hypothetical protein GGS21DRAFT_286987 [Xylaria nigripes]
MDGMKGQGARNLSLWERVLPADEPIYCPAPSPSGPDDIIYPGSDSETDEAAKLAKRLRYEEFGRHYLQGRPLRIFSASLRGPFDKDSGWRNPWLLKTSSQPGFCVNNSTQRPEASSAIKYKDDTPVVRLPSEIDGVATDVDDSIKCHLPSPQSHQDLKFTGTPSNIEKNSFIRSWAEQVQEGGFKKDQFWAPNQDSVDSNVKSTNKRSAGREWLKRRPVKKKRPDASQSTEPVSTPTPLPTSVPRCQSRKASRAIKTPGNRSFGITPSSSPEKGPDELPTTARSGQITLSGKDREPVPSIVFNTGSQMRTMTRSQNTNGRDAEQHGGQGINTRAPNDTYRRQIKKQTNHNINSESDEAIDFQDCTDDSFCYRARQLKRDMPPNASNSMAAHYSEMSPPSKYGNTLIVASNPDVQEPTTDLNCRFQDCNMTNTCGSPSCSSGVDTARPPREVTSNEDISSFETCGNVPRTVVEVKGLQATNPKPFHNKVSTVIGESMDLEQPDNIQLKKPTSATKPANVGKSSQNGNFTMSTKLDDTRMTATMLHQKAVDSEYEINGSSHQRLQGNVTNPTINADVAESQAMERPSQFINTSRTVPAETTSPVPRVTTLLKSPILMHHSPMIRPSQQSPWVRDITEQMNSASRVVQAVTTNTSATVNTGSSKKHRDFFGLDYAVGEEKATVQISSTPCTPTSQVAQESTPNGDVSIRSFSNFDLPLPPRSSICYSGGSANRSILSCRKDPSTHSSAKSNRHVSFAPLPHELDDDSQPPTKSRAASPPPPALVDLEGENVDGKYRNHFNLMNRRISVHKMPKLRYQQRLLPSSSQQKPASPPIDAMAKVFREADAHHLNSMVGAAQIKEAGEEKAVVEETVAKPQSPWREESQGIDDVAEVIGHLEEFLDVWDVNSEIDRSRAELDVVDKNKTPPSTARRLLQGVGIW